jgi:hypothetical protein
MVCHQYQDGYAVLSASRHLVLLLPAVNLWFESNNIIHIHLQSACFYYLKHVLLVVVTVTLLPCDVSIPWYVISIKMVMQSCLSHVIL